MARVIKNLLKFSVLSAEIRNPDASFQQQGRENSQATIVYRHDSCGTQTRDAFGW